MNTSSLTNIQIIIDSDGFTPDEMNIVTKYLRNEITNIDEVESVEYLEGIKPKGTKGLDPVLAGALVIAVLPTAIPKLIDAVIVLVNRQQEQRIKVRVKSDEIEVDVPLSMKPDEAEKWVRKLQKMLKGK